MLCHQSFRWLGEILAAWRTAGAASAAYQNLKHRGRHRGVSSPARVVHDTFYSQIDRMS